MVKRASGFTLIEVMIAITILAGLTLLTSRAMRAGILNKQKFQADISREAAVRDALRVMERDINLAYHYRDTGAELLNQAKIEAKKQQTNTSNTANTNTNGQTADNGANTTNAQQTTEQQLTEEELERPAPQWTGFIGESGSLYFSSLSNVRLAKDSQQSNQAEIGYYTRSCKSADGNNKTSTCLVRSVAPFIDDDLEKGGQETVLLENVVDFKMRYMGPGVTEWQDSWATKTVKRSEGYELFPYAVEIYLKTHNRNDPKDKPFEMGAVASIRFPNNDPKKEADALANRR